VLWAAIFGMAVAMSVVSFFVNSLPRTPNGVFTAIWGSMASLFDAGQVPKVRGGGSHIILVGWLFFILVSTSVRPSQQHATHTRVARTRKA
jgi:hypothetical protein